MTGSPFFMTSVLGSVPPVVEYNLWGNTTMGTAQVDGSLPTTIVLGTKFRSSSAGNIVGIRWQKDAAGQGVIDVALFSGSTNMSGTRTVSGEGSSGWQRMNFASPVAISADTIYTAAARYSIQIQENLSYYATNNYFSSAFTNAPLEAVANATSTNGVFTGVVSEMVAPVDTWQSTSYFIDVIFTY